MPRTHTFHYFLYALLLACVAPYTTIAAEPTSETVVLSGATLYTVTQGVIPRARIIVRGGKIVEVGTVEDVLLPPDAKHREVFGKVIIPGLVDTHSHLGVYPRPRIPAHADGNETSSPLQSSVRAIDAIYPSDAGIRMALAGGITTTNVMPGSGNPVGGQTAYIKLSGETVEEMVIDKQGISGGMKMANGENPKRVYGARKQAPVTRMGIAALQRQLFVRALNYKKLWDAYAKKKTADPASIPPARDIALDPVLEILDGRRIVHFHVHRADDIMTAIRLAEEFQFRLVLQHVSEGYKVANEIARRQIPCSIIVLDAPGGKPEAVEMALQNATVLERAGVQVAFHTDAPITDARFLLRMAALAVRAGMPDHKALRAVTIDAAGMLDLAHRIGSVEVGKDADLVVLSGRPFSVYTKVLETYINGHRVFHRDERADRLYATGGFAAPDLKNRLSTQNDTITSSNAP